MNRVLLVAIGGLALLFTVLTVSRIRSSDNEAADVWSDEKSEEKRRVVRFWQLHREAGVYRTEGNFERAIPLYEAALTLDEQHEDALYFLGNSYLEVDRFLDAERVLKQLVEAHPTSSRGHSRRGDVHLCFDDAGVFAPDVAKSSFLSAVEINKEETGPMLRLGQVALVEHQPDDARRWLEGVIGTNATSIEAHYLLGYVDWIEGRAGRAGELYTRAVELADEVAARDTVSARETGKGGARLSLGEQITCPTMLDLIGDIATSESPAKEGVRIQTSYDRITRRLHRLRRSADDPAN